MEPVSTSQKQLTRVMYKLSIDRVLLSLGNGGQKSLGWICCHVS